MDPIAPLFQPGAAEQGRRIGAKLPQKRADLGIGRRHRHTVPHAGIQWQPLPRAGA